MPSFASIKSKFRKKKRDPSKLKESETKLSSQPDPVAKEPESPVKVHSVPDKTDDIVDDITRNLKLVGKKNAIRDKEYGDDYLLLAKGTSIAKNAYNETTYLNRAIESLDSLSDAIYMSYRSYKDNGYAMSRKWNMVVSKAISTILQNKKATKDDIDTLVDKVIKISNRHNVPIKSDIINDLYAKNKPEHGDALLNYNSSLSSKQLIAGDLFSAQSLANLAQYAGRPAISKFLKCIAPVTNGANIFPAIENLFRSNNPTVVEDAMSMTRDVINLLNAEEVYSLLKSCVKGNNPKFWSEILELAIKSGGENREKILKNERMLESCLKDLVAFESRIPSNADAELLTSYRLKMGQVRDSIVTLLGGTTFKSSIKLESICRDNIPPESFSLLCNVCSSDMNTLRSLLDNEQISGEMYEILFKKLVNDRIGDDNLEETIEDIIHEIVNRGRIDLLGPFVKTTIATTDYVPDIKNVMDAAFSFLRRISDSKYEIKLNSAEIKSLVTLLEQAVHSIANASGKKLPKGSVEYLFENLIDLIPDASKVSAEEKELINASLKDVCDFIIEHGEGVSISHVKRMIGKSWISAANKVISLSDDSKEIQRRLMKNMVLRYNFEGAIEMLRSGDLTLTPHNMKEIFDLNMKAPCKIGSAINENKMLLQMNIFNTEQIQSSAEYKDYALKAISNGLIAAMSKGNASDSFKEAVANFLSENENCPNIALLDKIMEDQPLTSLESDTKERLTMDFIGNCIPHNLFEHMLEENSQNSLMEHLIDDSKRESAIKYDVISSLESEKMSVARSTLSSKAENVIRNFRGLDFAKRGGNEDIISSSLYRLDKDVISLINKSRDRISLERAQTRNYFVGNDTDTVEGLMEIVESLPKDLVSSEISRENLLLMNDDELNRMGVCLLRISRINDLASEAIDINIELENLLRGNIISEGFEVLGEYSTDPRLYQQSLEKRLTAIKNIFESRKYIPPVLTNEYQEICNSNAAPEVLLERAHNLFIVSSRENLLDRYQDLLIDCDDVNNRISNWSKSHYVPVSKNPDREGAEVLPNQICNSSMDTLWGDIACESLLYALHAIENNPQSPPSEEVLAMIQKNICLIAEGLGGKENAEKFEAFGELFASFNTLYSNFNRGYACNNIGENLHRLEILSDMNKNLEELQNNYKAKDAIFRDNLSRAIKIAEESTNATDSSQISEYEKQQLLSKNKEIISNLKSMCSNDTDIAKQYMEDLRVFEEAICLGLSGQSAQKVDSNMSKAEEIIEERMGILSDLRKNASAIDQTMDRNELSIENAILSESTVNQIGGWDHLNLGFESVLSDDLISSDNYKRHQSLGGRQSGSAYGRSW